MAVAVGANVAVDRLAVTGMATTLAVVVAVGAKAVTESVARPGVAV